MSVVTFTVHQVSRREDEILWDLFVQAHPEATGYHLIAWRKVMEEVFGHRTVYLFAKDEDDGICGVLPLAVLSSPFFGTFAISLPAVNYGGVVADDPAVRNALLDSAAKMASDVGASHIELRQTEKICMDWPNKQNKVSMRLSLPGHYDVLWGTYSSKLRSQIRRAEKEGMMTRFGGTELVADFYDVFSKNMRDLGTPVYSIDLFKQVLWLFPKDARIGIVYLNERPVAAGFLYGFRDMIEIPWASSDRRYARSAPNMLLYGEVLKYACEQGYRTFDFGRSSIDSGTYRFKEQWGARSVPLNWHYWLRDGGPLPELNPQNPKYALAIRAWQCLPVPVTTWIGPMISKYLP